jgi:hypothetical protein
MSNTVVVLTYGLVVGFSLLILWLFEPIRWYWHVIVLASAIGILFAPIPAMLQSQTGDVLIGSVFLMLFTLGVAAPLFRNFHHHHHHHHAQPHAKGM